MIFLISIPNKLAVVLLTHVLFFGIQVHCFNRYTWFKHENLDSNDPGLFCELFNDSVRSVILHQHWQDGNITPLCSNYRPVILTSQVVKLLERLMQNQILKHVKKNNILTCDQHGEKHFLNFIADTMS